MIDTTDPRLFIRHADAIIVPHGPRAPAGITGVLLTQLPRHEPLGNFHGPSSERAANNRLVNLATQYERDPARPALEVQVETTLDNGVIFTTTHRLEAQGWGTSVREHISRYLAALACNRRLRCELGPQTLDALRRLVAGTPDQVALGQKLCEHADQEANDAQGFPGVADYFAHLSLALRRGLLPRAAVVEAQQDALDAFPTEREGILVGGQRAMDLLSRLEAGGQA